MDTAISRSLSSSHKHTHDCDNESSLSAMNFRARYTQLATIISNELSITNRVTCASKLTSSFCRSGWDRSQYSLSSRSSSIRQVLSDPTKALETH